MVKFKSLEVHCFAKINLFLNISHKRSDGFHEIQSLFQTVSLCDVLTLTPASTFKLIISNKSASFVRADLLEKNNILQTIFNYFATTFNITPLKIELNKKIPLGAGLGGGSSDAAGLILALNHLNSLSLSQETLEKIGSFFGSDVPFFIRGGLSYVTGRGEKIKPMVGDIPKFNVILIYPEIHIDTKKAYKENLIINKQLNFSQILRSYYIFPNSLNSKEIKKYIDKIAKFSYNGFEEKTLKAFPRIYALYTDLKQYSNYVLLSGSGSSVFALFEEKSKLGKIAKKLNKKYSNVYLLQTNDIGVFFSNYRR